MGVGEMKQDRGGGREGESERGDLMGREKM
jgi:hypothetical protein